MDVTDIAETLYAATVRIEGKPRYGVIGDSVWIKEFIKNVPSGAIVGVEKLRI